jgi:ABC-type branched-subunit amino acid transport system substrate-binding protein
MSTERRRCVAFAIVLGLVLGAAPGCSGESEPLRVGVLADCAGFLESLRDVTLASASLPLLERGGTRTAEGGAQARIAGRRLKLIPACTEFTYLHLLILATRRLVENDKVDVVVGPIGATESVVFRRLAARYPDVTFIAAQVGAQETTLKDPQRNLFRFTSAGPQNSAGLGSYAYHELGWRRAVVVGDGFDPGSWGLAAGFVSEFCALGGDVVERDWFALSKPTPAAARHASEADGVLLAAPLASPAPYLTAYSAAGGALASRLLVAGSTFLDRRNLTVPGVDLNGVVAGGSIPVGSGGARLREFRSSFADHFPQFPATTAQDALRIPEYTAVEALVSALERTHGELGEGQADLRAALSDGVLDAPQGKLRLDGNRQVVSPIYLERIVTRPGGGVSTRLVRRVTGVEQTFGGLFTSRSPSPSWGDPVCKRATPPAWAR